MTTNAVGLQIQCLPSWFKSAQQCEISGCHCRSEKTNETSRQTEPIDKVFNELQVELKELHASVSVAYRCSIHLWDMREEYLLEIIRLEPHTCA